MDHIWTIYGPYMDHIWTVYGPYMDHMHIHATLLADMTCESQFVDMSSARCDEVNPCGILHRCDAVNPN